MTVTATPHVAQISFLVDSQRREPARLLQDWPSLVDVAEATSTAGARVSVIQACTRTEHLEQNAVDYYFFSADPRAATVAATAELASLILKLRPDVLHVHGLCFPQDVVELARIAPTTPILLQDHASRVPRAWRVGRRRAWRRAFSAACGIAFCARDQSLPFAAAGMIDRRMQVYQIPESSSHFQPGSQTAARSQTGLAGDPCLLWVGHLNPNKDPLAVLDGVSAAVDELPGLQLWCCFGDALLRVAVVRRIERDPRLSGRVHLLGSVPHHQVELLMRAADFFVLGSHREGSGYSVIEALACGLPPLITAIPSFRALTANGSVGWLWPCGDSSNLSQGLVTLASRPRSQLRLAARAHFDRQLSFGSVGAALLGAYRDLMEQHAAVWQDSLAQPLLNTERESPVVSIILPTFNRLEYLRAALESVFAQTFRDWELLIVDDGSDTETREYLRTIAVPPQVRVLWLSHTGNPPLVRNCALRKARGEYVAFLDSDDVWMPGKLQSQLESLRDRTQCEWSYTGCTMVDGAGLALSGERAVQCPVVHGRILNSLLQEEALIVQSSVLVRRRLLEQVGGYDERLPICGDYELWIRLAARSEVDFIDESMVRVRRHDQHYAADVDALEDLRRALEKVQRSGVAVHLDAVLSKRRAGTSTAIARGYAKQKKRLRAFGTLASSFPYSWTSADWWIGAFAASAQALLPLTALEAVRRVWHGVRAGDSRT